MAPADPLLRSGEPIEVVFTATSPTEALVIRGLLESAGIPSPALGDGYLPELKMLSGKFEIYALRSEARHAKAVIAEYLADIESVSLEADGDDEDPSNS